MWGFYIQLFFFVNWKDLMVQQLSMTGFFFFIFFLHLTILTDQLSQKGPKNAWRIYTYNQPWGIIKGLLWR